MSRQIIFKKAIIDFDIDGQFYDGIVSYQIRTDGKIDPKIKSVGIKNSNFSQTGMVGFLHKIKNWARRAEKIEEE